MKPRTPDSLPVRLSPSLSGVSCRRSLGLLLFLFVHLVLPVVGPLIIAPGLPVRIVVGIHLVGMVVPVISAFHGCASLL